jgi:small-conductance mechanosensitive channel
MLAHNVVIILVIAAITWSLLEVLSMAEDIAYMQYSSLPSPEARNTIGIYTKVHIVRNIAATIIIILAIAASLMVFDKVRDIGISILASAGFLTAMVALAAQKSLSSILVGIKIALSQSIKMGDYITIENQSGTVEEISLSYVTMKLGNDHRLVLPIQYFIEKPFQNLSRGTEGILGTIKLYVNYNTPINSIREKLLEIIQASRSWDKRNVALAVGELKENSVELWITVSASNPQILDVLTKELREKMLDHVREHHPFSLMTINTSSTNLLGNNN